MDGRRCQPLAQVEAAEEAKAYGARSMDVCDCRPTNIFFVGALSHLLGGAVARVWFWSAVGVHTCSFPSPWHSKQGTSMR